MKDGPNMKSSRGEAGDESFQPGEKSSCRSWQLSHQDANEDGDDGDDGDDGNDGEDGDDEESENKLFELGEKSSGCSWQRRRG